MSDALQALYAGETEKAHALLPDDDQLSVFEAAAFGREDRLRAILRDDPLQAAVLSDDGFTALHLAVFGEQDGTARLLVEGGADVNTVSGGAIARVPPLGTAAFVGSVRMARLLLDAGADVNGRGDGGFTALHSAAHNGNEELVRLLLERGADAAVSTDEGKRPADFAADTGIRRLLASSPSG